MRSTNAKLASGSGNQATRSKTVSQLCHDRDRMYLEGTGIDFAIHNDLWAIHDSITDYVQALFACS